MPRIRKKTSNRQNTRDRAKIKKHVAEHKKKSAKASKKDVTWKSKKKADPGVPNSFVHKDKVLAEMAAEKRAAEEAKIARRQASKAQGKAPTPDPEEEETPGIQSILSANVQSRDKAAFVAPSIGEEDEDEDEVDVPDLVDTSLTTLQEVLDKADVVVEVVDARDIAGGRSKFVEELVKEAGGRVIVLVNKIDRVPRETLQAWMDQISLPTFLFKSILPSAPSTSATIDHTIALGKTELLDYLSTIPPSAGASEDLSIALMGLPNVGKTSVLNALLPAKAKRHDVAPILALNAASKNPQPTTKLPREARIEYNGKGIRVIDTPGWEFADDDDEEDDEDDVEEEDAEISEEKMNKLDELEARMTGDLLRRNLGRVDRIKDVISLADYIVTRSNAQDLMLAYNVPFFKEGDTEVFLTAVARSTNRLRKGNQPDLESAARHIVRDWAQNTFPYYSLPPKSTGQSSMQVDKAGQPDMSTLLERCTPRKEMRKLGKGVIRFRGGEVDEREVILDDDYTAGLAPSDDEDEEDDDEEELELEEGDLDSDEEVLEGAEFEVNSDDEEVEAEDDEEDAEDEEEEEDEEASPEPSPPRKLKRKADTVTSPGQKKKPRTASNKRVSFGGKLGATGNGASQSEKEVKSILKRDREGNVKQSTSVAAAQTNGVSAMKTGKGSKKAKVAGAYDFSAHF